MRTFTIAVLAATALAAVIATALGTGSGAAAQTIHVKQSSLNEVQGACLDAGGTIEGWKFIITLQAPRGGRVAAPANITVQWDTTGNGVADTSEVVPLQKQAGISAHYFTDSNPGAKVIDATAVIDDRWTGQFVLSSVDCVVPKADVKLKKKFQVGPFTSPGEACFTLTPNTGTSAATQCATGNSSFRWNDLTVGDYKIEETTVPAGYAKMADILFKVRVDCTGESGICFEADDPPAGPYVLHRFNPLEKGRLQVLKKLGPPESPSAWVGPSVTFHVCQNDPKDNPAVDETCDGAHPRLKDTLVVPDDGNPAVSTLLAEAYYTVCEVVPAGFEVSPSRCQAVQVLAGSEASANQVTFINTPADLEGCSPGYWLTHATERLVAEAVLGTNDFHTAFGLTPAHTGLPAGWTLLQALQNPGGLSPGPNPNNVNFLGTAAILSAAHPDVNYKYTVAEVRTAVQAVYGVGTSPISLADLEDAWERFGCPLD